MRKIKLKEISENYEKLAAPSPNARHRPSIGLTESIGEFYYLKLDDLETYDKQARKHFDTNELNHLADTIREHGIRQPLSVIKTDYPGKYQVISGERRLRAAKIAGLEKVPCIIISDNANPEEIAIIENIQRADLHPIELGEAYASLLKNFNHGDKSKLAQKLGVNNSHVSEALSLTKLPQSIKAHLIQNNIRTRLILRKLPNLKNVDEMKSCLGMIDKPKEKPGKRKFIFSFFVKNGAVSHEILNLKMTEKQKAELKEQLLSLIKKLES